MTNLVPAEKLSDVVACGDGRAIEVQAIFRGRVLDVCHLPRRGSKRGMVRRHHYVIGSAPRVDAPVATEFIENDAHELITASGDSFQLNVTAGMQGDVVVDGETTTLTSLRQRHGGQFVLPARGHARIVCGNCTFLVHTTPPPTTLPRPLLRLSRRDKSSLAGTTLGLLFVLGLIVSVPPDAKSLATDGFRTDGRLVDFVIKPREEPAIWLRPKGDTTGHKDQHPRDVQAPGRRGPRSSKNRDGRHLDPHVARQQAEAMVEEAGILAALTKTTRPGSALASIFGRTTALGESTAVVLGGLTASRIDAAAGVGGLALTGTGAAGAGEGEGTIGVGALNTIGKGGRGTGTHHGQPSIGRLQTRGVRPPEITTDGSHVRGALDREIVRRIVRRHINQVKYCYEQELVRQPELGGRVAVTFTIAALGQVVASALQDSTLNNPRVETCVLQAVRRWEFPKPAGGGIVIVTYPFQFTPAGDTHE